MRTSQAQITALASCCIVLFGGCGGGSDSAPHTASGKSPPPIPLATFACAEWQVSPPSIRKTVIAELRRFYGGPVSGQRRTKAYGTVLTDTQAGRLFDGYCRQPFARNFTLYKLYARATAFAGGAP